MGFWKGLRMNTALKYALGALVTTVFSGQALACYTVYNSANQVVYQAQAAPVDMRYQLHQTLPAVFPGGHMGHTPRTLPTIVEWIVARLNDRASGQEAA